MLDQVSTERKQPGGGAASGARRSTRSAGVWVGCCPFAAAICLRCFVCRLDALDSVPGPHRTEKTVCSRKSSGLRPTEYFRPRGVPQVSGLFEVPYRGRVHMRTVVKGPYCVSQGVDYMLFWGCVVLRSYLHQVVMSHKDSTRPVRRRKPPTPLSAARIGVPRTAPDACSFWHSEIPAATTAVSSRVEFDIFFALQYFVVFFSQVLDLSANSIEGLLPFAAGLPALVELILDENSLRALGDELVGLSKLKKLSARSNRIAAVDPFSGQQVCMSFEFCSCCTKALITAGVFQRVRVDGHQLGPNSVPALSFSFSEHFTAWVVGFGRVHLGNIVPEQEYRPHHGLNTSILQAIQRHKTTCAVLHVLKSHGKKIGNLSKAVCRFYGGVPGARRQRHGQDGPDADGRGGRFPGSQRKKQEQEPAGRRDADALRLRP